MKKTVSRYWFCQLAGWGTYIIIFIFLHFLFRGTEQPSFLNILFLDAFLGLVITHLMRLFIKKMIFLEEAVNKQSIYLVLTTLVFSSLYAFATTFLAKKLGMIILENQQKFNSNLLHALLGSFLFLLIWNVLYFTYHFIEKNKHISSKTVTG